MASVHLARLEGARGIERWVAVKVIHPHLADDRRFVEMFLDEARVVSRIAHSNVCAMLEYGEEAGVPFLVMEYLHGVSMSAVLKAATGSGAGMKPAMAARVIAETARGLHAAHELRGANGEPLHVVHRDVSPQNIHVGYDGAVKVMDFGIASSRGRLSTTTTGELKGKFSYMAPEQLRSEPIDRRTDVWALGVVLWEALTGQRLFRADSEGATAVNVLTRPVEAPSNIRPELPLVLDEIVDRAVCRDIDQRYASAAELAHALERFLHDLGEPFGAPQIAGWMADQFEEDQKERELLLESTSKRGPTLPAEVGPLRSATPSDAPTRLVNQERGRPGRARPGPVILGMLMLCVAVAVGAMVWSPWSASESTVLRPQPSPAVDVDTRSEVGASEPPIEAAAAQSAEAAESAESAASAEAAESAESAESAEATPTPAISPDAAPSAEATPRPALATPRSNMRRVSRMSPMTAVTAESEGEGTLSLLAIPASEVFLGSRRLGRTPLVSVSLPVGRHRLRVRALSGGLEEVVSVTIRAGESARQTVLLQQDQNY